MPQAGAQKSLGVVFKYYLFVAFTLILAGWLTHRGWVPQPSEHSSFVAPCSTFFDALVAEVRLLTTRTRGSQFPRRELVAVVVAA
jgi:hypothetical protein